MSKTSRRVTKAPPPLLTIDDDDEPRVKKEAEEEETPNVAELKEQLEKTEKLKQKAIEIAGRHLGAKEQQQKRVVELETAIDSKACVLEEAKKAQDELKNQLAEKEEIVDKLRKHTHEIKDEVIEGQGKACTLEIDLIKEKQKNDLLEKKNEQLEKKNEEYEEENEELKKKVFVLTKEKEEERRRKEESAKENEELRGRLMEMEKKMREMNGSVPVNDEQVDGEEARAELRKERGEEPMERMEMDDQTELPFNDNNLDMSGMDGYDDLIENREEENDTVDQDLPDEGEVGKRRRSSRNATKLVKYAESMEESDEDGEPSVKKKRSESAEKKEKVVALKRGTSFNESSDSKSIKKDNEETDKDSEKNDLECPECEYHTTSVTAWYNHLRDKHSTTPTLAGCLLRCECGYESYSKQHVYKCEVANFTIVRTGDGTIRRLTDPVTTPQCVLCKAYPKTVCGYNSHLTKKHKSTLRANGIYLKCECGYRCTSDNVKNHDKKCTGRDFSLHKLDEE